MSAKADSPQLGVMHFSVAGTMGALRAAEARCCPSLHISTHNKLETTILKYVACRDTEGCAILSASRYLFSSELIEVLCSLLTGNACSKLLILLYKLLTHGYNQEASCFCKARHEGQ